MECSHGSSPSTEEADLDIAFSSDLGELKTTGPWKKWIKNVFSIEFAIAVHAFASGLHSIIRTNLLIEKTCRVDLSLNSSICDNINHYDKLNDEVEETVTKLNLQLTFLSALPCTFMSMLIGPWSDQNGRKPVLLIPIIGHIIANCVYIFNVYFWNANAYYILFSSIYSLFGGTTTLLIGVYSYIADTTSTEARTSRVAIMDVAIIGGWTSGNFLSAIVYENWGFYGNFGITIALLVFDLLFIAIFLEESRKPVEQSSLVPQNPEVEEHVSKFGVCGQLKDMFKAVGSPREGYTRAIIIILLSNMLIFVGTGSADVNYLFTRKMFNWSEAEFTRVSTFITVLQSLSSLILLPMLSYKLHVPDPIIGTVATISSFSAILGIGLSKTGNSYIFASCLGLMSTQVSTVIRSLLSKVVPETDLGKVYTVLGCLEAAIPLVASPILIIVYNNTLESFPGAVYLTEASAMAVAIILFTTVALLMRRESGRFQIFTNEE